TMLKRKSSLTRTSQAPASTRACNISTPGITGKVGKWSARYSSPSVRFFVARINLPGMTSAIRSTRLKRIPNYFPGAIFRGGPTERGQYTRPVDNRQPRVIPAYARRRLPLAARSVLELDNLLLTADILAIRNDWGKRLNCGIKSDCMAW